MASLFPRRIEPRIDQFLRITIGTDTQCRELATALRTILANLDAQ